MPRIQASSPAGSILAALALCCTACTPQPAPAFTPKIVIVSPLKNQDHYHFGETIEFTNNILVLVEDTGATTASGEAAGAVEGSRINTYVVIVENHSGSYLDLSEAHMRMQYDLNNQTLEAGTAIDISNLEYGYALGLMATPVPTGKASEGAWMFSLPEEASEVSVELKLESSLSSLIIKD